MDRRSRTFKDIASTLRVYHENVSEDDVDSEASDSVHSQREILQHLITFLEDS